LHLIAPLWHSVCRVAGVDGSRYLLLVEESDEPNAFAAGGRTVAVTRPALQLPPPELEAVLAHELGHHLSAHPMVSRMAWWYAIPARLTAFLAGLVIRVVLGIGRVFLAFGNGLGFFASLLAALIILTFVAFLNFWLILIPLISPLLAWASRLGEFRADRTAALLGYGPALGQALRRWQHEESRSRRSGLRDRVLATHPPTAERIRRLQPRVGPR
jgi:STE24 endopeptidase